MLPGTMTNFNALEGNSNLNDVNAKSADLNDRNRNLNDEFHGTEIFCKI